MSNRVKYLAVLTVVSFAFSCTNDRNIQEETIRAKFQEFPKDRANFHGNMITVHIPQR